MLKLPNLKWTIALALVGALTSFLSFKLSADPTITVKPIAPGISLTQEIDSNPALIINVLSVDLKANGVHLGVGIGKDFIDGVDGGREEVSRAARRHGAIAAINADFFPYTGDPLGLGVRDGEMYSEPWTGNGKPGPRTAFGVLPDGRVIIDKVTFLGDLQAADGQRHAITGIDRPIGASDTIVFTSTFGPMTAGNLSGTQVVLGGVNLPVRANKTVVGTVRQITSTTGQPVAIPPDGVVIGAPSGEASAFLDQNVHLGDTVEFVLGVAPPGHEASTVQLAALPREPSDEPSRSGLLVDRPAYLWAQVAQAVSGGPRLLVDGKANIDGLTEGFGSEFTDAADPRTAAGVSADGKRLILVTVDGRQSLSTGVTLTQLASILLRYGAAQAINFDGGGSTALSVAGVQVNSPGGTGYERPVADMLFVYSDHPYVAMAPVPAVVPPIVPVVPAAPPAGVPSTDAAPPASASPVTTPTAAPSISMSVTPDPSPAQTTDANSSPIVVHVDKDGDIKLSNEPAAPIAGPHIVGSLSPIGVGSTTTLHVVDENGRQLDLASPLVIWQGKVTSGIAFVSQRGELTALTAGSGTATALYAGQLLTFPVTVSASDTSVGPTKLTASFAPPAAGTTQQNQLIVTLTTATGAPIAGATVVLTCTGGTCPVATLVTNQDGYATTTITWSETTGGSVSASTGTLAPVSVSRPQ